MSSPRKKVVGVEWLSASDAFIPTLSVRKRKLDRLKWLLNSKMMINGGKGVFHDPNQMAPIKEWDPVKRVLTKSAALALLSKTWDLRTPHNRPVKSLRRSE